jgi:hypothetical protein
MRGHQTLLTREAAQEAEQLRVPFSISPTYGCYLIFDQMNSGGFTMLH